MRSSKGPPAAGPLLPFVVAALLLASSCAAGAVGGFAWKDREGSSLEFAQSSSWPRGEEGRFGRERQSNRYSLKKSLLVPAGSALIVAVRRGTESADLPRIRISLSPKADGSSAFASAAFPLLAARASLAIPLAAGSRLVSVSISEEGQGGAFFIDSIAIGSAFRGIEGDAMQLRVSSGFSLVKTEGYQELAIEKPFSGLPSSIGTAHPGLLIEYGPSPRSGSQSVSLGLEAKSADGSSLAYTLRAQPAGARTVLDPGLLGSDPASVALRLPLDLEIKAFYAAELKREDFELADLGRVLLDDAPSSDFSLYHWDLLPNALVFDFKDYASQDRYLKRLAFFVEKLGFRGRLARDEEIAPLHGYNAHDYRSEDLAAFFNEAKAKSFPLSAAEKELEALLLREGVIAESGGKLGAGRGAMISIARESGPALRRTLLVHESTHAIFFSDADYRAFARSLWSSLDKGEKWFWTAYLGWAAYDVGSDYLMANEFQAYLMQQPVAAAEEYFAKRKAPELLEKHPELEERVAAYMEKYASGFPARARQLELWLRRKYGVEAGRTVFLTRR